MSELKLLVDAVEASHFITQAKSAELIGKLSDLTSSHNADKLSRHIYLSKRMKSDNEEIYDVVDKIHAAINSKHQITFLYYEYDSMKNRVLRNDGNRYQFSPYGMTWEDNKYYVVGFSVKHKKIISFRVDRMSDDEPLVAVTLKCKNRVMKSMIDRFGIDVQ
ncbi:MAG: WYL domain-containing protein [Clostridia bacterium]|nr:WYL domain-containing protein [Clostridia bacterium]